MVRWRLVRVPVLVPVLVLSMPLIIMDTLLLDHWGPRLGSCLPRREHWGPPALVLLRMKACTTSWLLRSWGDKP